jgi:hypothetical protein
MRSVILMVALSAVYLLTMPTGFPSGDAASEVEAAASINPAMRANHLLTTPLYKAILHLGDLVTPAVPGFIVIQIINIILAMAAIFLFYRIALICFREHPQGRRLAFWLAAIMGLCNAMWIHSTTAETGIHPQLFLMAAAYLLLRYAESRPRRMLWAMLSVISLSISVLFALYMVVLFPIFLAAIAAISSRPDRVRGLAVTVAVAALACFLPFLLAARLQGVRTMDGFLQWMTFHTETARIGAKSILSLENFMRPVAGITSAFVNTGSGLTIVKLLLRKEIIHGLTTAEYLRLALGVLISAVTLLLILRSLRVKRYSSVKAFCLASLVIVYMASLFWLGSDPQFWLPVLPMLLILMAIGGPAASSVDARGVSLRVATPLIAGALLVINLPTVSPSMFLPQGGREVRMARDFTRHLSAGDVVITPGSSWVSIIDADSMNLHWFNLVYSSTLGIRQEFYTRLDSVIDHALGSDRKVFLEGLEGPATVGQFGNWEMIKSYRGVSRAELKAHLAERYNVELFTDFRLDPILVVGPRETESEITEEIPPD